MKSSMIGWKGGSRGVIVCAATILGWASVVRADAATDHYVSLTGTNNPRYINLADAVTQIQWAVDVAAEGDTVWVADGTYTLTNQITITEGIAVRSLNGKEVTFINGNYPHTTNRCFFTLHNIVNFFRRHGVLIENPAMVCAKANSTG